MRTFLPRSGEPFNQGGPPTNQYYKFLEELDRLLRADSGGGTASGVQTVNGISPDSSGNVQLDAGDVGADPAGTANIVMQAHLSAANPHPQYLLAADVTTEYSGISAGKLVQTRADGVIDGSLSPGNPNRVYASRTLFVPSDMNLVNGGLYIETGGSFVNDGGLIIV